MFPFPSPMLTAVPPAAAGGIPSGAGSYTAYRYARIQLVSASGYRSIKEIELYGATLGTDLTSPTTTISASTIAGASESADKAIDNNTANYWTCSSSDVNGYITIDFGAGNAQTLRGAAIMFYISARYAPFYVKGSNDGSTWTQLLDYSSQYQGKFLDTTTLANDRIILPLRIYRLTQTAANAATYSSIGYIELRDSGGTNLLVSGAAHLGATKTQTGATEIYTNVVDPSTSNDWTVDYTIAGGFPTMYFYMQNQTGLGSIAMRSGVNGTRAWKSFQLDYSDDAGLTWTPGLTVSNQTGWANNETRVFSI